jgi:hypothetical protein
MSSEGMGSLENVTEYNQPNMPEIQKANPQVAVKPSIDDAMTYRAVYPEIYFKIKPHIEMACDVVGTYGSIMPTQGQLEQMSDGIFEDVCKLYPDMADYMRKDDPAGDPPPFGDGFRGGFRPGFGFGFRRRGLGRDLIDTLLLAELLNRGYYYYY